MIKCPHCNKKLEKTPSRKTKCPFCKQDMYIRTDLLSRKKVLVTKKEADKIDKEWEDRSYTDYDFIKDYNVEEIKKELEKRFDKKPGWNDIEWFVLQKEAEKLMIKANQNFNALYDLIKIYNIQIEHLKRYKSRQEYIDKIYKVILNIKNKLNELEKKN